MLFLLLLYALSARAQSQQSPSRQSVAVACTNINECRTLTNIIWSCVTTISLCTWVAMHPNIPEPVDTSNMSVSQKISRAISRTLKDKPLVFLCAVLVPEYILSLAIRQSLMARRIVADNVDLSLTPAHGFFMLMGGFHYFRQSDDMGSPQKIEGQPEVPYTKDAERQDMVEHEPIPVHPLTYQDVITMVRNKQITLPTESEIQDKAKRDSLAKILVVFQTLWFIMQCIARRVQHLSTTELEIVTLAYAAMTFAIFIAWWDKPYNIGCPVRVFQKPPESDKTGENNYNWVYKAICHVLGMQDIWVNLHHRRRVPVFYSGTAGTKEAAPAYMSVLIVGVVFGGIHCIAWNFRFESQTQASVWRLSSAVITGVPIVFLVITGVVALVYKDKPIQTNLAIRMMYLSMPVLGLLYAVGRFATLVLAFMNLSKLPPSAFRIVHWTTLLPHL